MIFTIEIVGLTFINFAFCSLSYAEITDKQYASMPDLFHQDNYDKCMLLEDEALYCSFTYELEPLNPTNVTETWKIIQEVSSDRYHYRHDHLRHSICVPFTCPNVGRQQNEEDLRQGITQCYNAKLKKFELEGKITKLYCQTSEPTFHVDWLDITVAIFFAFYVALIMFASIYEYILRCNSQEEYKNMLSTPWRRTLAGISLQYSWKKLKAVGTSPRIEKLRYLQGLRLQNMVIVIWAHTSLFTEHTKVLNTKYGETNARSISNMLMSSSSLCLSINFFMSTFLLTEDIFLRYESKTKIGLKHILLEILHRYLRLTPTMVVVVLFYATWLRHLGTGPEWNIVVGFEFFKCRQTGWMNILYINSILPNYIQCLGQTWYLAYDMLYFVIFVPILLYMTKNTKMIWPILASMLTINMLGTFIQSYRGNYEAMLFIAPETLYDFQVINSPEMAYQATSFIGNIGGSIFGVGYGYLFHKYRNQKLFTSTGLFHAVLVEVVTHGLCFGMIVFPGIYFISNQAPHDPFWASLYVAFLRPIYMLLFGTLIFAATQEVGLSRHILNWPPFYILGKLTYCVYLIHMVLIVIRAGSMRPPVYNSGFNLMHTLLGNICMSFIAALLLTLFVEMPCNELQKLILPIKRKPKEESKRE